MVGLLRSPPRIRGTRPARLITGGPHPITPAHVGNTGKEGFRHGGCSRSPPRKRGTRKRHVVSALHCPINPAHAGNTILVSAPSIICTAHPPTHAGNTCTNGPSGTNSTDHPRARGEQLAVARKPCPVIRSPPRMRGKLDVDKYPPVLGPLTPIPVGNTARTASVSRRRAVHPRARGDHPVCHPLQADPFTPTHVGNTIGTLVTPQIRTVHPHARGEHVKIGRLPWGPSRSPLHPWGTLSRRKTEFVLQPITPMLPLTEN